jgi:hypothetical protein
VLKRDWRLSRVVTERDRMFGAAPHCQACFVFGPGWRGRFDDAESLTVLAEQVTGQ